MDGNTEEHAKAQRLNVQFFFETQFFVAQSLTPSWFCLFVCLVCLEFKKKIILHFSRCGYTGEDGFELAMPASSAISIASKLLSNPNVNPTGLGARDSLRLEAGLCLYGHDLNDNINPVEAALGWTLGPPGSRRRTQQGFLGAPHILTPDGKFQKVSKKRVGIAGMKAPAREHTEIYDASGTTKIGEVTSGTFGPSVNAPVAMGYVDTANSKVGTEIMLNVRGKMQKALVSKMPFITPGYYKVPE